MKNVPSTKPRFLQTTGHRRRNIHVEKTSTELRCLLFNIQRFSVHDGQGIRTLIFTKGCPLRCRWCSNPESINPFPEISFIKERCIGTTECGRCRRICPTTAIEVENSKIVINRALCINCAECAKICPAKAIRTFGEFVAVDDVLKKIEEDNAFYARSGGGVTVSGGEPLLQAKFVQQLFKSAREHGLSTAIETSGHANWLAVERACEYADQIFYDIKHMDPEKHKLFTGVTNKRILENIERISNRFRDIPIIVRTPIVPEYNDTEENIEAIANFLKGIKTVKEYELLPYHGLGAPKYIQLGREYHLKDLSSPSQAHMEKLRSIAQTARLS